MTKPFHPKIAVKRERKETCPLDTTPVSLSSTVNAGIAQFNILILFKESLALQTNFSKQMLIPRLKQTYNQDLKAQVPAVNKDRLILYSLWPHTGHKLQEVH